MGKGIAVLFKKKFGGVGELMSQGKTNHFLFQKSFEWYDKLSTAINAPRLVFYLPVFDVYIAIYAL